MRFFACQKALQWKGMRRGLVCEQPLTENIHVIAYARSVSSSKISAPIRNNKKLTFSNPHHPFDYAVNSTLFCIAFFIGATLAAAACEGVRKSDVRSTAALAPDANKNFALDRESAACASRCAARRFCTRRRQPLGVRASSYLLNPLRRQ
jgi:hypothetical protein